MFKNDERYWDINLLNKWFGISSLIFLFCMVWVFIDDNDDEFKIYQKKFRELEIDITQNNLDKELETVKESRKELEKKLAAAKENYISRSNEVGSIEKTLTDAQTKFYKANMDFQGQKAMIDEIKFLVESENVHDSSHEQDHRKDYDKALAKLDELKLIKENYEIEIKDNEEKLKDLKNELKKIQDERDFILRDVNIADGKLKLLDRSRMSFLNKIGDIVRDLPILDFMDPYYKVNQIVVKDVHYDVNFTTMPVVDRCTSCHLGISDPDFTNVEQPFTTHPDLELYLTSASPHPLESFGCTSCHAGRSRGTSFLSSAHTPNSPEQKHEWEQKFDWEKIHHWLQPMLPKKYTEANCFKCHMNTSDLAGAEKLNMGLTLVDKSGCNGCHVAGNWPSSGKTGPDLRKINEKLSPDWVAKWIKNPRSFRHNTRMPSIFEQDNQTTEPMSKRNVSEIASITHYLFNNKSIDNGKTTSRYLGSPVDGEKIFQTVGCMGCHISEIDASLAPSPNTFSNLTKLQGPNLIGMGSKVSAEWLFNWLKQPHDYMASTRMPNLRLSDQEAKDLTAYLLDSKIYDFDKSETPEMDPAVLDELTMDWLRKMNPEKFAVEKASKMSTKEKLTFVGEKSIRHYGCFGCHNIDGFMDAKPIGTEITYQGSKTIDKYDFGLFHDIDHTNFAWIENKLRTPRIYDRGKESNPFDLLKMPNFYFTEDEIEAITTAILAFNTDGVGEDLLAHKKLPDHNEEGHRLVKKYNCQGCHLIEDRGGQLVEQIGPPEYGPPNLNTEGKKANPNWLLSFFKDPIIIRPNIQVRMPSFHQINDREWDTIIKYFQSIDDENVGYRADHIVNEKSTEFHAGDKLHELGACNNCHFYGTEFPKQTASTWAANLAMTKVRFNPDWIIEWLRDPQEIMPGTKMPAPYLPTPDVLDVDDSEATWGNELVELSGDQDAMLEGLRDYLWTIDGKVDISQEVKDYFEENGYDFSDIDDEDEWDDEDW